MSQVIVAKPLTRENFAAFGDVIDTGGDLHYPINSGKTERYHALAKPEATGPNGHRADQPGQGDALRIPAEAHDGRAPSARQPGLHPAVAAPLPGRRLP